MTDLCATSLARLAMISFANTKRSASGSASTVSVKCAFVMRKQNNLLTELGKFGLGLTAL